MSRNIIYSTEVSNADIAEVKKYYGGNITDDKAFELAYENKANDFDDLVINCKYIKTNGSPIICIANLGLWNGRRDGYKVLGSTIDSCFTMLNGNYEAEWYLKNGNLRCTQRHHDGTNYLLFRQFKPNVTQSQIDNFCQKVYNGVLTEADITRYTEGLGKYFR